jgi:hypothetical protein
MHSASAVPHVWSAVRPYRLRARRTRFCRWEPGVPCRPPVATGATHASRRVAVRFMLVFRSIRGNSGPERRDCCNVEPNSQYAYAIIGGWRQPDATPRVPATRCVARSLLRGSILKHRIGRAPHQTPPMKSQALRHKSGRPVLTRSVASRTAQRSAMGPITCSALS